MFISLKSFGLPAYGNFKPRPVTEPLTVAAIADELNMPKRTLEWCLADALDRGLIGRKKVSGKGFAYWTCDEMWAAAPEYEPAKVPDPVTDDEPDEEPPDDEPGGEEKEKGVRNGLRFFVRPNKKAKIPLPEPVSKVEYVNQSDQPTGVLCEAANGILTLTLLAVENAAEKATEAVRTVAAAVKSAASPTVTTTPAVGESKAKGVRNGLRTPETNIASKSLIVKEFPSVWEIIRQESEDRAFPLPDQTYWDRIVSWMGSATDESAAQTFIKEIARLRKKKEAWGPGFWQVCALKAGQDAEAEATRVKQQTAAEAARDAEMRARFRTDPFWAWCDDHGYQPANVAEIDELEERFRQETQQVV
jgi:hypothetical protein